MGSSMSDSDLSSVPEVVAASAVAGPSSRRRAGSALSSSSELTDPNELEDLDDTDASEDDDIVLLNKDGSSTAITRLKMLLRKPTNEPKHRWETAYIYAFVERFTSVQKDSVHAPQTILEFETALESGVGSALPACSTDRFEPSLEPVFTDFVSRVKASDRASGGTGGMKGSWQSWLPWWIDQQRNAGAPEFAHSSWSRVVSALKAEKGAIYNIDWDRKLLLLKALVDYQLSQSEEIKAYINDLYGYGIAGSGKDKDKKDKSSNIAPAHTNGDTSGKSEVAPKETGKASTSVKDLDEKGKEPENIVLVQPIGQDSGRCLWYRMDDSPRLYINSKPSSIKQNFVAASDTIEEIEEIVQCLRAAPVNHGNSDNPFSKTRLKRPKSSKDEGISREQALHTFLSKIVLPSLMSEDSPYWSRVSKFTTRRYNIVKKRDREARLSTQAVERAAFRDMPDAPYGGSRSSTRLRRGTRQHSNGNGYDESARDDELERALRASEMDHLQKRRRSGSTYEEPDYRGMDLDENSREEEEYEYDVEDESQRTRHSRKSSRHTTSRASKPSIPGERRSMRARAKPGSRDSSPEINVESKPAIVRSYSPEHVSLPIKFGGLEEVWSKGRYLGYYSLDGTLVKAQKGDMPLYKLAKLGLPMPGLSGVARVDPDISGISGESLPGSAVPTLEMENGNESRGSPASTIEAEDNRDRSQESSPGLTVISCSSKMVGRTANIDPSKPTFNVDSGKQRIQVVI